VVILPDEIPVGPELDARIEAFVAAGGKVLATGRSGLSPEGQGFGLSCIPATAQGPAAFSPDFLRPGDRLAAGLRPTDYVMYDRGVAIQADAEAEVLAETIAPYFNRTWEHFCSHRHSPSTGKAIGPAAVAGESAIYFAHPLFTTYANCAPVWCKLLLQNALEILLPDPILRIDGPSSIVATVNAQPAENRQIIHLLGYIPERRGQAFDVIEDVLPVRDVRVSLRAESEPQSVRLVPEGSDLPFRWANGRVELICEELRGHAMIEVAG
jgi:hypothetical protein